MTPRHSIKGATCVEHKKYSHQYATSSSLRGSQNGRGHIFLLFGGHAASAHLSTLSEPLPQIQAIAHSQSQPQPQMSSNFQFHSTGASSQRLELTQSHHRLCRRNILSTLVGFEFPALHLKLVMLQDCFTFLDSWLWCT